MRVSELGANMHLLLGNRLLREVLATISDQPDIELIGEVQEKKEEIEKAVNEGLPDLLIVALGISDSLPEVCHRIREKPSAPKNHRHCTGPGKHHVLLGLL